MGGKHGGKGPTDRPFEQGKDKGNGSTSDQQGTARGGNHSGGKGGKK